MTSIMNQYRNEINVKFGTMSIKEGLEALLKAKRYCDEGAAASEEAQSEKQIKTARKSLERLRATVEACLEKRGWEWDEFEGIAERMLGKSEGNLAYRLTTEGSLNMDMDEMKM